MAGTRASQGQMSLGRPHSGVENLVRGTPNTSMACRDPACGRCERRVGASGGALTLPLAGERTRAERSGPSGSAGRGDLWTLRALRQRWDVSGRGVLRISPEDNPFAGRDPLAGRTISRLVKLMCSTSADVFCIPSGRVDFNPGYKTNLPPFVWWARLTHRV